MTKLKHRIRSVASVLTPGRQLRVTLLVLVISTFLPAIWTSSAEPAFRGTGAGLQLAGLVLVAQGIHETRRRFNRPSLAETLTAWFRRLKNALARPPITASGEDVTIATGTGELTVTGYAPRVYTNLEQRVAALEAEVEALSRRLSQYMTQSDRRAEDLRRALTEEVGSRESSEAELRRIIEAEATGGLNLEMMGLVWLVAGTVAGSFSVEFARLVPGYPWI
jgi:hypothetical protein